MILLRILLLPVSIIYGMIIQCRNFLYDRGVCKIHTFAKPLISIGNITAGGSGKTPLTIHLAELLIQKGKKVAIISRGYKRKSRGFQLVSDGKNFYGNTKIHGDEAVLCSLLVPAAIVAVCEKRFVAVEKLLSEFEVDYFLLDDAFQHRSVARNIDIVLLPAAKTFKNKMLLPSGVLREFYFNLKRADILVALNKPVMQQDKNLLQAQSEIDGLRDIDFHKTVEWAFLKGKSCVAFAGIAYPQNFNKDLADRGLDIKLFLPFKDHHDYTVDDMEVLIKSCLDLSVEYLICTEKDLVKIREISAIKDRIKQTPIHLYAVGLKLHINNMPAILKKEILS